MTGGSLGSMGATVLGYPRIGRRRELKKALEAFWSGKLDGAALDDVATAVRLDALDAMVDAGLDTVPVNTFSWYDQMLDTAVLLGAVPERFAGVSGQHQLAGFDAQRYFAMARGTDAVAPLEMTKWFDTNYHYLVPEIGPETTFALSATKPLQEFAEASKRGVTARPVVVGPWTFLSLAKAAPGAPEGFAPRDRVTDVVAIYAELLQKLRAAGAEWVQLDEPAVARNLSAKEGARLRHVYELLSAVERRPQIFVPTYFAEPLEGVRALARTAVDAIGIDLTHGTHPEVFAGLVGLPAKTLVLGVVNGRNVWRTDLRGALAVLTSWRSSARDIAVSSSCSLQHVPYDLAVETDIDPAARQILAFADQKLLEVVALRQALESGNGSDNDLFAASDAAIVSRRKIPGLSRYDVATRIKGIADADRHRAPQAERDVAQGARFALPLLPTTTIGSFPQTPAIRKARQDVRAGRIDQAAYVALMRQEIRDVIALQEDLGLDVLVHGEPERNDMVQYFAEQLDGYLATAHGWVQSYGSRCVRPPILYGDVHRPRAMTVEWATFAQSLTTKPLKGMLTGPVTMLAWSFVRDDQPRSTTADQVALALRDEVADLERAGIAIIQVDEPALRELLPMRRANQAEYLDWAVKAFRLATSGVAVDTQIHTHLCYSEFGEIIDAIDGLDADVTSIEAARSGMELLGDVADHGFSGALGPGVYDIHSPRVPGRDEVEDLIRAALTSLPAKKLWINPDCGLKTRGYDEVREALAHVVAAAHAVRSGL